MHYKDIKKFLKNLLWNPWSDFKIVSQECSSGDPFEKLLPKIVCKNCSQNFGPSINMALVNGGYLHLTDITK